MQGRLFNVRQHSLNLLIKKDTNGLSLYCKSSFVIKNLKSLFGRLGIPVSIDMFLFFLEIILLFMTLHYLCINNLFIFQTVIITHKKLKPRNAY